MRIFLFSSVPWKLKFLPNFQNCPNANDSVTVNKGCEMRHSNMSTICNATVSHCRWRSLRFRVHHVFSDAGPKETPMSRLDLCRKCCHFFGIVQTSFGIAFLCTLNAIEHRHKCDHIIERFWSLPVQNSSKMFLDIKSGSTW